MGKSSKSASRARTALASLAAGGAGAEPAGLRLRRAALRTAADARRARRRPEADRQLLQPRLRHRRARVLEAAVRRRAGREGDRAARRPSAAPPLPRHPRARLLRRRAGAALDRLPAGLPARRPLLRLLHGPPGEHPGRPVQAQKRDASRAGLPPRNRSHTPPRQRQPQRRPAAVPRPLALPRHGRRRRGRRPAEQRAEPAQPAGQAAARRPARSPSPCDRPTASACATPSASPSTG